MFLRRDIKRFDLTIPAGTNPNSNPVDPVHYVFGSTVLVAALGSSIKFQVSNDGSNWVDVVDDTNTAIAAIDSSSAKHVVIPVTCFTAIQFRIAVTGTVATETVLKTKMYS